MHVHMHVHVVQTVLTCLPLPINVSRDCCFAISVENIKLQSQSKYSENTNTFLDR